MINPSSEPVMTLLESGEYDNEVIVSRCDDCLRIFDSDVCSHTSSWPVFDDPNAIHSPDGLMVTFDMEAVAIERVWMLENEGSS